MATAKKGGSKGGSKKSSPKKPSLDALISGLDALSLVDGMFDEVCQQNKEKFGEDSVYTGSEADRLMICLPVPSLSTRVLLRQEGLPLGKHMMVVGLQECFKSTFCDEVIRWHRIKVPVGDKIVKVGKGYKFEVENKQWAELTNSILEYDDKAIETHPCRSLDGEDDGWMNHLTKTIQNVQDKFEPLVTQGENKGKPRKDAVGRIAPACFVIDSVMGALSEATGDKIEANGAPSMSFPVEARKISDYMKKMPKWAWLWPFTIVGVNHKKVHTQPDGKVIVSMPGGAALKFHESMEFDMRRIGPQFHRLKENEYGVRIRFDVLKNSTAPKQEDVEVEVVWWYDQENLNDLGQPRQVTIFDWHSATIEMLAGFEGTIGTKIAQVIDLHVNKDNRKVWSKALGISEKSPVKWREAGAMLEDRPDLLYPLYDILGIRRRFLFQPGIDFRKQYDYVKQQMLEEKAEAESEAEVAASADTAGEVAG